MKITPISFTRRPRSAGFSLIELLVVVSIIAVLAASSVGIYGKVINTITATKARNVSTAVVNGIKSFYSEYSTWPVDTGTGGDDTMLMTDDGELIRTLMAKNPQVNTKAMNFLEGMKQAKKGPEKMEDGLDSDSNPESPRLLDPWGNAYRVIIDSNFDDLITNPDSSGSASPIRYQKVVMFSAGKDGNYETWTDNVKTW